MLLLLLSELLSVSVRQWPIESNGESLYVGIVSCHIECTRSGTVAAGRS